MLYRLITILTILTVNWSATACSSGVLNSDVKSTAGSTTNQVVPDVSGMTLKGRITCDGIGVSGVEVSDGVEVTQTNMHGIYYLKSKKKYGYVFISIPSGYEVPVTSMNIPLFFKPTTRGTFQTEQIDFILNRTDNGKYAILAMADFHLCNRTGLNDLKQFRNIVADINSTIHSLQSQGFKVYGLSLGDESWDQFWYANSFDITSAFQEMKRINCPLFHSIGNHDNDPYYADDWLSEQEFIRNFPVYYSFNLGSTHYIVLDDVQYINTGASIGNIGERNFNAYIINEELEWLKKDLAMLLDKSMRIVVAMHVPLFHQPSVINGEQTNTYRLINAENFVLCFDGFTDVHILSGHTHDNYNVDILNNIREHNIAGICATWWWTNLLTSNQQHICKDGSPGGYGVYLSEGSSFSWYYKSYNFKNNYQFRTYDLNQVFIDDLGDTPSIYRSIVRGYGKKRTDNKILINVWNYNRNWKIDVTENGTPLKVTRVSTYDPLHILCYDIQRYKNGNIPTAEFVTIKTDHMFECTALSDTSTIAIKITDEFGNTYSENMARPKAFNIAMQ